MRASKDITANLERLLGSATTLLTLLSNPLNITLLTSQLLSASSIWQHPDGLHTTVLMLSIFSSAAIRLDQQQEKFSVSLPAPNQGSLGKEEWAIAVIKGADDRSPRWRHLCVLAGLLIGFDGRGRQSISRALRQKLGDAIVLAANMALEDSEITVDVAGSSVVVLLGNVFDVLSDAAKLSLKHDLLLPILYRAPLLTREGLYSGYFLSTIDADIVQVDAKKFDWSAKSSTYAQCQRMARGPLLTSLGSLSRLTAFSIERVHDVGLLSSMITDLSAFTRSLSVQWRQNKLSEIDITEEAAFLSGESLRTTVPLLLNVLKSTMFAIVVMLRSLLGRVLKDPQIPSDGGELPHPFSIDFPSSLKLAPFMAIQTLQILRNLYFTSSRHGANAFSQYTFVYLTAIDILSQHPGQAEAFLQDIRPVSLGSIHQHPLDRCHDLYFLNTAEHFTTILSPTVDEQLLVSAATPYLGLGSDPRLSDIFEAAHSVMLAVFAAPLNSAILNDQIHSYLQVLFQVFPKTLSPRQFRMAVKTLIRVTSPSSTLFAQEGSLPSTILELVLNRLQTASSELLRDTTSRSTPNEEAVAESVLSEQCVLTLTLIDALAYLPVDQLEDWLPIVADALRFVQDAQQLQVCRERFWQALSTGEMDLERASLCLTWWSTKGGRDMVLNGLDRQENGPFMSGGLQESGRF